MTKPHAPREADISVVEASFTVRISQIQKRAQAVMARLTDERRALEGLVDTKVSAEAVRELESPRFNTRVGCVVPSFDGKGGWTDESFWNAFDAALRGVCEYEGKLDRLERELHAASARVAGLRLRALTSNSPEPAGSQRPDLRRSPRIPVCAEVEVASSVGELRGLAANISESGLFVASGSIPGPGAEVDLALSLPDAGWFEARAVVRWGRRFDSRWPEVVPGIGLEFVQLDEPSTRALQRFLEPKLTGGRRR